MNDSQPRSESLLQPFRALRAPAQHAARVAAPPYDVLDTEEARALAAGNEDSFLHVSKPEIDFPPGTDPHAPEVHAHARARLQRLRAGGRLVRDADSRLYVYALQMGTHRQTGIVGAASVQAYREGRIRRHEHTKADKVDDRARNADALDAHTGTLFLTHRAHAGLAAALERACAGPADIDFIAADGIRHSVWSVAEAAWITEVTGAFDAMPCVYIADGHHRSAAAERLATWRSQARARGEAVADADRFLAVSFPDDQVQILPYHRVVATLGGHDLDSLLSALSKAFEVAPSPGRVEPDRAGTFGMYVDGRWFRLTIRPQLIPDDPVARLDISLLQDNCLGPVLGIGDQRTDPRIDFVGGIRGAAELERRVDSGGMKVAFALCATRLQDMFRVADAGEVMPPKSTWFEPKLRDGLLVLPLGQ